MLTPKQSLALDLLFTLTPEEAAERLDVRPATLRRWMADERFARHLRLRYQERREAARRIAAEGALAAARLVEGLVRGGDEKGPAKAVLDLLKMSGIFEEHGETSEEGASALAGLIAQARESARAGGG